MTRRADRYAGFVDHPRYGRRPHVTGLDVEADFVAGTVSGGPGG